ncbi:putative monooxygenase [Glonium stellatum]|uniref:Putative monooxygenase n=1 Tax=Glonium stellatum TaxID=574774 RepID=A0A8E2EQB9_9PEZI|nr:putative monooxygenase [Glonium stellatum]
MPGATEFEQPIDIAIVGAGIVGLALSLGLNHRNFRVKIYEQSKAFGGFGGGIGFSPNAVRCMQLLHPQLVEAQRKTATSSGDPKNPNDWMVYIDGYHHNSADPNDTEEKELFRLYTGRRGFEGCVRAQFQDELINLLPPDIIEFGKRLERVVDRGDDEKLVLHFQDGDTAEADAVIGCDGIKSRVRKLILGEDHPAALPSYNHQYALRGLVPMDRAIKALGEYKARNRHIHLGPGAYVITIPVAHGAMVNVVAFVTDPQDWSPTDKLTAPANKTEAIEAFANFGPAVKGIIGAITENSKMLDKWAIFDSFENPAPTYARGRVCIAGDAAHASAPHHGAGAGCGIEDDLALASLLVNVSATLNERGKTKKAAALRAAFTAYSNTRIERTQWLVRSSRFLGEALVWRNPKTLRDFDKCSEELTWRSHKIWDFDEQAMLRDLVEEYEQQLKME